MTQRTNLDVLASHRWRLMSLVSSPFRRLPLFTSTSSPPSEIAIEEAEEWFNVGCTHASIKANTQDLALKFSTWFKWAGHMTFEQRDRHKVLLDVDGWGWFVSIYFAFFRFGGKEQLSEQALTGLGFDVVWEIRSSRFRDLMWSNGLAFCMSFSIVRTRKG